MSLTECDEGQLRMLAAVMADMDIDVIEGMDDIAEEMGVVFPAAPNEMDCCPPSGDICAAAAAAA